MSEAAKHTPGPWTNDKHSTFVWSKDGNVCACGDPHVQTTVGYTECRFDTPALSEAVANARLIAAAPDMLAALQKTLLLLIVDGDPPGLVNIEDTEPAKVIELYEAISATIAKATEAAP